MRTNTETVSLTRTMTGRKENVTSCCEQSLSLHTLPASSPPGGALPALSLLLLLSRARAPLPRRLRRGRPQPPALPRPAGLLHANPTGGALPRLPVAAASCDQGVWGAAPPAGRPLLPLPDARLRADRAHHEGAGSAGERAAIGHVCVCVCENTLLVQNNLFSGIFLLFLPNEETNGQKLFVILPAATRGRPRCLEFCEAHVAVSAKKRRYVHTE